MAIRLAARTLSESANRTRKCAHAKRPVTTPMVRCIVFPCPRECRYTAVCYVCLCLSVPMCRGRVLLRLRGHVRMGPREWNLCAEGSCPTPPFPTTQEADRAPLALWQ